MAHGRITPSSESGATGPRVIASRRRQPSRRYSAAIVAASSSSLWKQLFDAVESRVGPTIDELARSDDAVTLAALGRRGRRELERRLEQASRRTLHMLNMPAGSDVNRLLEHITRLEREVRDLRNDLADKENTEYLASLAARPKRDPGEAPSRRPAAANLRRSGEHATEGRATCRRSQHRPSCSSGFGVTSSATRSAPATVLKHLAGVGRPVVGCSEKDVVWQRDKVQLYRYRSENGRWHRRSCS